jgi:hypothetical protein
VGRAHSRRARSRWPLDGELGIALACVAIGSIVAMPIAGGRRRAHRQPPRHAVAFGLLCLATALLALAPSLPVLCALALLRAPRWARCDVTMKRHGVAVERRYGRVDPRQLPRRLLDRRPRRRRARRARAAPSRSTCACTSPSSPLYRRSSGLTWSRRFLGGDADALGHAEPIFVRPPRPPAGPGRARLRLPDHRGRVGRLERRLPARRARHRPRRRGAAASPRSASR